MVYVGIATGNRKVGWDHENGRSERRRRHLRVPSQSRAERKPKQQSLVSAASHSLRVQNPAPLQSRTLCFLRFRLTPASRDLIHIRRSHGARPQGERRSARGLGHGPRCWRAPARRQEGRREAVQQEEERREEQGR
jgi:hypothetical protein